MGHTFKIVAGIFMFYAFSIMGNNHGYATAGEQSPQTGQSMPGHDTKSPVKDQSFTWNLTEAITMAVKNNPDMVRARESILKSKAAINKAKAIFWPKASVYTGYTQGDSPSAYLFSTIDQRSLAPGTDFNQPGWFENYESGIRVNANLYNGGRDLQRMRTAETSLSVAKSEKERAKNLISGQVSKTYCDIAYARRLTEISRESVELAKNQIRKTQVRYENGGALKSDLLALKVFHARAKEELIRAENIITMSNTALAILMGLSPDTAINIDSNSTLPLEKWLPENYQEALKTGLSSCPELQGLNHRLTMAEIGQETAKSTYLPSINLAGKYYYDDSGADYSHENWNMSIMMDWNVFSGFSTRADMEEAMYAAGEVRQAIRKSELAVAAGIKKAYLKLGESRARVEVAEANQASALELMKIVKQRFNGGTSTITEFLETEFSVKKARTETIAARLDLRKSMVDILMAAGIARRMYRE